MDLFCIDFAFNKFRFNLNYLLLSIDFGFRIIFHYFFNVFNLIKSISKNFFNAC